MVTFSGSFTNEDLKGDTGRKDPVDEVIDILTAPTVGSGPPRGAPARAMRNVSAARPSVNVQQLDKVPLNLNDLYGDGKSLGLYTRGPRFQEQIDFDLYNALNPRPQDNASGFQQASAPSLGNIYGDGRALGLYTPPQERAEDFRQQELNRMQGSLPVMPYTYPGGEGNQELAPQGGLGSMMFPDPTGGLATRGDPRGIAGIDLGIGVDDFTNRNKRFSKRQFWCKRCSD